MSKNFPVPDLVGEAVKTGGLPGYLYKYRGLGPYTKSIFENKSLWFDNPPAFNDPFDCQIVVDTNNSVEEIEKFINENQPGLPRAQARKLALQWNAKPKEWDILVRETIDKRVTATAICCFAGSGDNILMWSHYAESHRGICLKFDVLADTGFFTIALPVHYKLDYPVYNHLKDSTRLVPNLIQTKSNLWKYEQEVRVLKPVKGPHAFKKEALTEIIFGCTCSDNSINEIKRTIKANDLDHVLLKRATKKKDQFGIELIKV